jgi:hypothetical protein
MAHYPTYTTLSTIFSVSTATVSLLIDHILGHLLEHLSFTVRWPSEAKRERMMGHFRYFPSAIGIIDGTFHSRHRTGDNTHCFEPD